MASRFSRSCLSIMLRGSPRALIRADSHSAAGWLKAAAMVRIDAHMDHFVVTATSDLLPSPTSMASAMAIRIGTQYSSWLNLASSTEVNAAR